MKSHTSKAISPHSFDRITEKQNKTKQRKIETIYVAKLNKFVYYTLIRHAYTHNVINRYWQVIFVLIELILIWLRLYNMCTCVTNEKRATIYSVVLRLSLCTHCNRISNMYAIQSSGLRA